MYEEQVKLFRYCAEADCTECAVAGCPGPQKFLKQAADVIEELIPFKKQVEKGMGLLDKADELLKAVKPRWIPVTEHLPEKNQIVVVHEGKGTWDFGMFRGISPSGNPEYWHWKKNTFKRVKWWMSKDGALLEPPKEEPDD